MAFVITLAEEAPARRKWGEKQSWETRAHLHLYSSLASGTSHISLALIESRRRATINHIKEGGEREPFLVLPVLPCLTIQGP